MDKWYHILGIYRSMAYGNKNDLCWMAFKGFTVLHEPMVEANQ
jgi:hypothetical protein